MTYRVQVRLHTGWQTVDKTNDPTTVDMNAPYGNDTRRRPRRVVDPFGRIILQNEAAALYAVAVEQMKHKRATRKLSPGDLLDRAALEKALYFVVTILDFGVDPSTRPVYRCETLQDAARVMRAHKRPICYSVLPHFRQRAVTLEMLEEKGL